MQSTSTSSLPKNFTSIALPTCKEFLIISGTTKLASVPHSHSICHHSPSITLSKCLSWFLWLAITLMSQCWNKILGKQNSSLHHKVSATLGCFVAARLLNTVRSAARNVVGVLSGFCSYDYVQSYYSRIQMLPTCTSENPGKQHTPHQTRT
jgi:hypothetical protein